MIGHDTSVGHDAGRERWNANHIALGWSDNATINVKLTWRRVHTCRELCCLDIGSLPALRALGDIELHLLSLFERFKSVHRDRRKVREQIFATTIWRYKTEAL